RSSSADCSSTVRGELRRGDQSVPDPGQRLLAAEQLDALEQAGRDGRTGDRDADWLERLPRLLADSIGEVAERLLDRGRPERRPRGERLLGRREHGGVGRSRVVAVPGRDEPSAYPFPLEEEPGELRELAEPLDLLLDERCRRPDPLLGPVV